MEIKYKSWSEITIAQYYEIDDIRRNRLDTHEGVCKLISILADEPESSVKQLTIREIHELYAKCVFIGQEFPKKNISLKSITINGVKYNIMHDLEKYTISQFIDYSTFAQREHCISEILGTILIPEGKKYNEEYSLEQTIYDIEHGLDIATAVTLFAELKKKFNSSVDHTLACLEIQAKTLMKMTKNKEKKNILKKILEKVRATK